MTISTRQQAIFVAVEDVVGTAETLVGADALQIMNLQFNPTEGMRMIEREIIRQNLNPEKAVHGGSLRGFTFDVEVKGSGTEGEAPRLGRLLRACGFDETVVAATSVTYTTGSTLADHESVTIGYMEGPNYRVVKGCRGNVSAQLTTGEYARLSFTMVGHKESEAEASAPTASYESTVPPAFLGATFQIGGAAFPVESLSFDMSNTISRAPDPNQDDGYGEMRVTARNVTGSVNPEAQAIDTKDWIGILEAGTSQDIQTGVIGGTPGNQWALALDNTYFRDIGYGDREALLINDIEFGMEDPDSDFSLQFT